MVDSARNGSPGALQEVAVATLAPWPGLNPRRAFQKEALNELAASIVEKGVLQPLLVHVADGEGPWIVAGERRYRAAKAAKLETVPAIVRTWTKSEALEAAIIENLQREDVSPVEEAAGYRQWIDETGETQQALADRVGRSQPYIANRLRLLELPASILELVADGTIMTSWARDLLLPLAAIPNVDVRGNAFANVRDGVTAIAKGKGGPGQRQAPQKVRHLFGFWMPGELTAGSLQELVQKSVIHAGYGLAREWQDGSPREVKLPGGIKAKAMFKKADHKDCTCGSPYPDEVCLDPDEWIRRNDAARERIAAAEARATKKAERVKEKARDTVTTAGKPVQIAELFRKMGHNKVFRLTGPDGTMVPTSQDSCAGVVDPEKIDPGKLGWALLGESKKLVLVHFGRPLGAQRLATAQVEERIEQRIADLATEDRAKVGGRKLGATDLATIMAGRCGGYHGGSDDMSRLVHETAAELGMVQGKDFGFGTWSSEDDVYEDLVGLSLADLETLAKVVHLRVEEERLGDTRTAADKSIRAELAREWTPELRALAPDTGAEAEADEEPAQSAGGASVEIPPGDESASASAPYYVREDADGKYLVEHGGTGEVVGSRVRRRDAQRRADQLNAEEAEAMPA